MQSNPVMALRITLAIAAAALIWLAVYILFNDAVMDTMHDGAHALTFVSLFVFITCIPVAMLFRRFDKVRKALVSGRAVLGRWQASESDWQKFVGEVAPETSADRKMTLMLIVGFAVVVCAGLALFHQRDAVIFIYIALFIMGIGLFGFWLGGRIERSHFRYGDGIIALSMHGAMVNGVLHVWQVTGSKFEEAAYIEGEPDRIRILYSYWTRSGRQFNQANLPVPAAAREVALGALRRLHDRATRF